MAPNSLGAYLIVNADDYGCFRCVSKGILKAATHGIVTATGVFANAAHFTEHAAWLRDCDGLDVGVHLNLTDGVPLTSELRHRLARWSGHFPGKFSMAGAIRSGAVKTEEVRHEWRAQIVRCLDSGLRVSFLNSHEHMHMLPALFPVASGLAKDYDIVHLRFPASPVRRGAQGALLRGTVLRYHDWEGELRTLTSSATRELLQRHGVRLIGYRRLEVRDGRLVVRPESVH